jgi:hypothetical protein
MRRLAIGAVLLATGVLVPATAAGAPPSTGQCLDASEQGQAMRDRGKLLRARELLSTCASTSCPAPVRDPCAKWVEAVIAETPSIVIVVRDDADRDLADASVVIDGAARTRVTGQPVDLDPGSHTLAVEVPGYEGARPSFVANLGEKNRLVRVRLAKASGASAAAASSPPLVSAAPADASPPPPVGGVHPTPRDRPRHPGARQLRDVSLRRARRT